MNIESTKDGLLESLKVGESAAFKRLYKDHYYMIATFIEKNKGSQDDAQDIFQDTVIDFVKNIREPDFKLTAKIGTYLYSIARFKWLNQLRKRKSTDDLTDSIIIEDSAMGLVDTGIEELLEKEAYEERHLLIAKMLEELKEDCRRLLDSFYAKKLSLTKIAQAMGYTVAFVKVKKNRCMNGFKKKIEDHPDFKKLIN